MNAQPPFDPTMVLTWLAVKGMASRSEIERSWGSGPDAVELIDRLLADGDLELESDYYLLSESGDERLSRLCRDALTAAQQSEFEQFLMMFEPIDLEMKRVATSWQQAGGAADIDYDDAALAALEALLDVDTRLGIAVGVLSPQVAEVLTPYVSALDSARERLLSGTRSAFTGTDDLSYHSVWFVMHEIILRTAGQSR
jgi:hypothetical protein